MLRESVRESAERCVDRVVIVIVDGGRERILAWSGLLRRLLLLLAVVGLLARRDRVARGVRWWRPGARLPMWPCRGGPGARFPMWPCRGRASRGRGREKRSGGAVVRSWARTVVVSRARARTVVVCLWPREARVVEGEDGGRAE
jgi:hypothetical protein